MRHADNPERLVERVDTPDNMVEHEASSMWRLHSSVKSMEQVEYSDSLVDHVKNSSSSKFEEELVIQRLEITKGELQQRVEEEVRGNAILQTSLERRKQTLQKWRLELEQDVTSLKKQLQVEMDLRAALKV